MSYVTKEELENFVKKYPDDETLVEQYALAAEEMIEKYLGYSPELKEYSTTRYGDNGRLFELEAYPLVTLEKVLVNNNEIDVSMFRIKGKNYVEYNYGKGVYSADSLYSFIYTAGYETVPQKIKTTALQIASLMWESEGGNIAVSSTSFADNGSRVFNNFTADRFLKEIDEYKIGMNGGF